MTIQDLEAILDNMLFGAVAGFLVTYFIGIWWLGG